MLFTCLRGASAAAAFVAVLTPCVLAAQSPETDSPQQAAPPVSAHDEDVVEIVVQGSKRKKSLQDTDTAVTVFDADAIDAARLRDIRRLDDLVPNVQFNETGQLSSIFVTIRGVESNPFIVNRAAVYIDGIPFRELNNAVLNQIESIEVLRGPQGTLYGANSESGLVLVSTRPPSDAFTATLRATGTNFSSGEGIEADGFVAGPIIDGKLAGSVAFKYSHEDAFVRNRASSIGEPGEIREAFVQGRLRWTPTDRLTVDATAYYLDVNAPGLFDQEYVALDTDVYNANYADLFNGGRSIEAFTNLNDAPKRTLQEEVVVGFNAAYELDYGQIDVAASYRTEDSDARGLDFDFTAQPAVAGSETKSEEFWNAEIRFTSPPSERFDYILGVGFYDEFERRTLGTFAGPGGLDDFILAPPQVADGTDVSVFGSASYSPGLAPKVTLTLGLRYERARRGTVQTAGELDLGFGSIIVYPDADLSDTFEELLPRAALRYEPTDNLTLYVSGARGYVPGGFNLAAAQEGFTDPNILGYDTETLWSREVGLRWRAPSIGLRISGAAFLITSDNWQEIQVATNDAGRPVSTDFISSAASIRSRGFEMEAFFEPMDGLSINGNFGYVDSEYRDLQVDETTNLRGNPVQFVPEYDGFVAVRYQWPIGLYLRGEVGFTGAFPLESRGRATQPAVTVYGLQIGYETERFAARVFGENLTNERRASGLALDNLAFGSDGTFYAPLDAPRIVGLELEARF